MCKVVGSAGAPLEPALGAPEGPAFGFRAPKALCAGDIARWYSVRVSVAGKSLAGRCNYGGRNRDPRRAMAEA